MEWAIRTEADLDRLVKIGSTTESLHLDFKAGLNRGPSAQAELGRDIAQFANTHGGCLLVGVEEHKNATTNIKTANRLVGVKDPDKDREDIEAWIRNVLTPADLTRTIDFVPAQNVVVVAINVPASRRLIWVNDPGQPNKLEVLRRTNHGKEYMRPNEIEPHWSNTPRAAEIAFREAITEAQRARPNQAVELQIVGGVWRVGPHLKVGGAMQPLNQPPTLGLHDVRGFELRIPIGDTRTLWVPFELLAAAWTDAQSIVHVVFVAPVVYDDGSKRLQFDPFGFVART